MQTNRRIYLDLRALARHFCLVIALFAAANLQVAASDVLVDNDGTISVNTSNQSIISIMTEIEEQSAYRFFYSESIDLSTVKSMNVENQNIDITLKELLAGTGITYEVMDKQIILREESTAMQQAQTKSISGKVLDAQGVAIPGATIVVKGTTTGTLTDVDGNFTLQNVSEDAIIQISFVGMKTSEVKVTGQKSIKVALETEALGLDEVVAIGYGT
ncbi:MAG: carboxypeptidase-like regulatory domain-containing protein, partial [Mangrovibacterium sp.]